MRAVIEYNPEQKAWRLDHPVAEVEPKEGWFILAEMDIRDEEAAEIFIDSMKRRYDGVPLSEEQVKHEWSLYNKLYNDFMSYRTYIWQTDLRNKPKSDVSL